MTPLNTHAIRQFLREKYAAPAWAFFEEVRDRTGFVGSKSNRYCDALALSLWPSNGLELLGFEIKVSRGDWRRELNDPAKADEFQRWCDRWYVVAPEGIVPRDELPSAWGLMEVPAKGRTKLKVVVQAEKLAPASLDKSFVVALARRIHDSIDAIADARALERITDAHRKNEGRVAVMCERHERNMFELRQRLERIQEALGLSNYDVSAHAVAETLRELKELREAKHEFKRLQQNYNNAIGSLEHVQRALETLKEARAALPEGGNK